MWIELVVYLLALSFRRMRELISYVRVDGHEVALDHCEIMIVQGDDEKACRQTVSVHLVRCQGAVLTINRRVDEPEAMLLAGREFRSEPLALGVVASQDVRALDKNIHRFRRRSRWLLRI